MRGSASRNTISLGYLEARQVAAAVLEKHLCRRGRVRAQDDERHRDFPPSFIGTADHCCFEHRVVLVEDALYFRARNVLAPRDDHVLQPIDYVKVAVVVADADVPGVEPAPGEDRRGRVRVPPITLEHLRATHDDLPTSPAGNDLPCSSQMSSSR